MTSFGIITACIPIFFGIIHEEEYGEMEATCLL